jgi:pyrroline-5-carboxylate reductase
MIPNAPTIVGEGYNPVAFGPGISKKEKEDLFKLFKKMGDCPEVDEGKLEAYAIITAMGPTYLWFQLYELLELGTSFGLTDKQAWKGIKKMLKGAVETIDESGLSPEEVMDLVPVKPLGEDEAMIRDAYRTKLTGLYRKLKS